MDHAGPELLSPSQAVAEKRVDESTRGVTSGRVHRHPGGLVGHQQPLVFIGYGDRYGFGGEFDGLLFRERDGHGLALSQ